MDRIRFRNLANWINLSTPLGLAVARVGGATLRRGVNGLYYAEGYRYGFPTGAIFTVGDVLITRQPCGSLTEHTSPDEITHEERHAQQWTYCLGLPFLPIYVASMAWSWLRTGDRASACFFEQEAGLAEGNYCAAPTRPIKEGVREILSRVCTFLR